MDPGDGVLIGRYSFRSSNFGRPTWIQLVGTHPRPPTPRFIVPLPRLYVNLPVCLGSQVVPPRLPRQRLHANSLTQIKHRTRLMNLLSLCTHKSPFTFCVSMAAQISFFHKCRIFRRHLVTIIRAAIVGTRWTDTFSCQTCELQMDFIAERWFGCRMDFRRFARCPIDMDIFKVPGASPNFSADDHWKIDDCFSLTYENESNQWYIWVTQEQYISFRSVGSIRLDNIEYPVQWANSPTFEPIGRNNFQLLRDVC